MLHVHKVTLPYTAMFDSIASIITWKAAATQNMWLAYYTHPINDWLKVNGTGSYTIWEDRELNATAWLLQDRTPDFIPVFHFSFEKAEEALLFKLTWG